MDKHDYYDTADEGIIVFELDDKWTLRDFIGYLAIIEDAYNKINSFFYFSERLDEYIQQISHEKLSPEYIHYSSPAVSLMDEYKIKQFKSIIRYSEDISIPIKLNSVVIHSPGIVELIGNLNPLKIIADFITAWRHENTIREDNLQKNSIEKMKILADIFNTSLDRMEMLAKNCDKQFLHEFKEFTVNSTFSSLSEISKDIRTKQVYIKDKYKIT